MARPKVDSLGNRELDKAEEQFKKFDEGVQELTYDRMNLAPKGEIEPQTKLSSQDLSKSKDIYLKPKSTISSREKFNERFREEYNFAKEYVHFIAENNEIIGEDITLWTKPFPGIPAEQWVVPTNKPVWAPRYVAEQIRGCQYHRLKTQDTVITGQDGAGQYYGSMAVDTVVNRLDARPVSSRRSLFMGAAA